MDHKEHNGWYRASKLFAWVLFASLGLNAYALNIENFTVFHTLSETLGTEKYVAIAAFFVSVISGVGTISTVILGWRSDRRQSAEQTLKIQQLEIEVAEARRKANELHISN